jgi:uncharacterized repeat protein (TIGR03803 family)
MTTFGGSGSVGTVFRINPATKAVTVLRHLNLTTDGGYPTGNLVRGTDGTLYGMTQKGGANKVGTIFKIASGGFSVLRHLKLASDGGYPLGSLILRKPIPLVANAQAVTTTEDVAKAITLSGSGDLSLSYNIVSQPKNGKISGTGSARTYTPTPISTAPTRSPSWSPRAASLRLPPRSPSPFRVSTMPRAGADLQQERSQGKLLTFTASATDADAGQTKTFSLVSPPTGATIGSARATSPGRLPTRALTR